MMQLARTEKPKSATRPGQSVQRDLLPEPYPEARNTIQVFAMKFLAHALRSGVGMSCGPAAIGFLAAVVTVEDRVRYQYSPLIWQDQILAYTGLSRGAFCRVRDKLVQAGWLYHFPGTNRRAAKYHVLVPGGDDNINSAPLGASLDEVGDLNPTAVAESPQGVTAPKWARSGREPEMNRARSGRETSHLLPNPCSLNPSPFPSASGREEEDIKQVGNATGIAGVSQSELVKRIRELGVSLAESCLQKAIQTHRERSQPLERIVRVIEFIEGRSVVSKGQTLRPFGGGAVFRRLTDGELINAEPDQGWPKSVDPVWAREWGREVDRRLREADQLREQQEKAARERESRVVAANLAQLEFQFQAELERLRESPQALVSLLDEQLEDGPNKVATIRFARDKGLASVVVKRTVLRLLAAAGQA